MSNQRNSSGMQLSSTSWLENHHKAKENLRFLFAKRIAEQKPKSIVDIGCGSGLWLSIFNEILPDDCSFIGIDMDSNSLNEAKLRSKNWKRKCEWINLDINKYPEKIPAADLTLIFNFSSYVKNLERLFFHLSRDKGFNKIAIRQFLGDEIKFGPFKTSEKTSIDLSLKNAMENSEQIRYFDADHLISVVADSERAFDFRDFEMFSAFSPFNNEVWPYIKGTVEWTLEKVSKEDKVYVSNWLNKANHGDKSLYFYSIDWIALLV